MAKKKKIKPIWGGWEEVKTFEKNDYIIKESGPEGCWEVYYKNKLLTDAIPLADAMAFASGHQYAHEVETVNT